jgi:hypothetical protein
MTVNWDQVAAKLGSAVGDLEDAAQLSKDAKDGTNEELSLLSEEVEDVFTRASEAAIRAERKAERSDGSSSTTSTGRDASS